MSPPRVTGLLVWVLGAAVLGTVTWHAVGTVVEPPVSGDVVLGPAEVSQALASASAPPSAAPPSAAPPSASASPSTAPSVSASPSASARPAAPPPPTTTIGADDPATSVVRSWSVTGGEVAAACWGQAIELLSATPRDGWTVEVEDVQADWLAVEFHRADQETQVVARCVDGTPVLADRTSGSTPSGQQEDDDPAGDD